MSDKKITDQRMLDIFFLLKEIEVYLSSRLLAEIPTVPLEDMEIIAKDIRISLEHNKIEYK